MWKLQAKFQNLKVMAIAAIGTPGCLDGPELESLIKQAPSCAAFTGNMAKHRDAVAKGVSKAFKNWQGQVTVPGLPWYPAFAAVSRTDGAADAQHPHAADLLHLGKDDGHHPARHDDQGDGRRARRGAQEQGPREAIPALHDAIATALALAFLMWLPSQQVMLVLGKGPIPTFAPPFVPVVP